MSSLQLAVNVPVALCRKEFFLSLYLSFKTSKLIKETVAMGMSLHSSFCNICHTCTWWNRGFTGVGRTWGTWAVLACVSIWMCVCDSSWEAGRELACHLWSTHVQKPVPLRRQQMVPCTASVYCSTRVSLRTALYGAPTESKEQPSHFNSCCTLWILKQSSYRRVHLHRITELQHLVLKGLIKDWKWFPFPFLL